MKITDNNIIHNMGHLIGGINNPLIISPYQHLKKKICKNYVLIFLLFIIIHFDKNIILNTNFHNYFQ